MNRFWVYDSTSNKYTPAEREAFSLFPTIVNMKQKIVFCRQCHRWEYIVGFSNNILKTQCGKLYAGPFTVNNSIVNYAYEVLQKNRVYAIFIKSQLVSTTYRRLLENNYVLDLNRKRLYRNGEAIFENADLNVSLCKEITDEILSTMGEEYKQQFGLKPTVTSAFKGFSLLIGYMLSPFNINFYKIAQHWGLNPYDKEFASLSSGDTPDAENEMFSSMGIKPTKAIRKMYEKYPQSVICYAAAKDMGFTDVNILQKTPSAHFYCFLKYNMISFAGGQITYNVRDALKNFVADMLTITNQKAAWNSIERTLGFFADTTIPNTIIIDGITTYDVCHVHLTEQEKKDVLHEGFNQYTHDFLVRRQNAIDVEYHTHNGVSDHFVNTVFDIEDEFLKLEYKAGDNYRKKIGKVEKGEDEYEPVPDEDRYCFYVARDSSSLKTIGSQMHNCVGWGYTNAVKERRATIVYALYKDKFKICIEVTPKFSVRQSLGPSNTPLEGEALEAYHEWCEKKNIQFVKAFGVHLAP